VLHLWHAWRDPLEAARDAVLQSLRTRGQRAQLCPVADFLPLLQAINALIADSLRGAPLPAAQQVGVWVIDGAQALPAPHMALIERTLMHYPELPLRLVLLSQTPLAPVGPGTARVMEVAWREAEPARPAWMADEDEAPSARAGHAGWAWGLGLAALLAVVAGGAWWALRDARPARVRPAAPLTAPAASAPALARASDAVAQASEPASAPQNAASAAPPVVLEASAPVLAASTPVAVKTLPRSPLHSWVQALPEGSFLVLHAQFASAREAEAFKATDPLLANARIAQAAWASGQPARYGVLTGPFRSPERVSNYLQRLAWREQARSLSREALLGLLSP
jgi:hypothetical protein